jgi:hypothetical protein
VWCAGWIGEYSSLVVDNLHDTGYDVAVATAACNENDIVRYAFVCYCMITTWVYTCTHQNVKAAELLVQFWFCDQSPT